MSQKVGWEQKLAPALRRSGPEAANRNYRIIVEPYGDNINEIQSIIDSSQGKVCKKTNIVAALVAEVPFSAIRTLAESKQVKRIWQDHQIRICE